MNTSKSKKHKHANSSRGKSLNDETEVFVLPPNLLEKLGIQLGSIHQEHPEKQQFMPSVEVEKALNHKRGKANKVIEVNSLSNVEDAVKESSILETASLMKASVFLSPTFVPTVANVISGEVEISNATKTKNNMINYENNINTQMYIDNDREPVSKDQNVEVAVAIGQNHISRIADKCVNNHKINMNLAAKNSEVSSHNDETVWVVETSDRGDKKINIANNDGESKYEIPHAHQNKNKINIISEEVVNVENVSKCLNAYIIPEVLIPLKVDSVLSAQNKSFNKVKSNSEDIVHQGKKLSARESKIEGFVEIVKNRDYHMNDVQISFVEDYGSINNDYKKDIFSMELGENVIQHLENEQICKVIIPKINLPGKETSKENSHENNSIISITKENVGENLLVSSNNNIFLQQGTPNLIDNNVYKLQNTTSNISNNSDIATKSRGLEENSLNEVGTQVSEVIEGCQKEADFEQQLINMSRSGSITLEEKLISYKENSRSTHTLETKVNIINPNESTKLKTCVHGVEKPGGNTKECEDKSTSLKTYSRAKKQKLPSVSFNQPLSKLCDSNKEIDVEVNADLEHRFQSQRYCLCVDFGCLAYYDSCDHYEHIHFWKSENVNCEPELLFSIYNQDMAVDSKNCEDYNENASTLKDNTSQICWNGIYSTNNNENMLSHYTCDSIPSVDKIHEMKHVKQYPEIENNTKHKNVSNSVNHIQVTKRQLVKNQDDDGQPCNKKNVKCGVCAQVLSENEWERHTFREHCLVAWKAGSSLNVNNKEFKRKLEQRLKQFGVLKCSLCIFETKRIKKFLEHVQKCIDGKNSKDQVSNTGLNDLKSRKHELIKCGVCYQELESITSWHEHIKEDHDYLAWQEGTEPLNLRNREHVRQHLHSLSKKLGGLFCPKCGRKWKYAQKYLTHLDKCEGTAPNESFRNCSVNRTFMSDADKTLEKSQLDLQRSGDIGDSDCSDENLSVVKERKSRSSKSSQIRCGVCKIEVENEQAWYNHIWKDHGYLAWREGETPLNPDNDAEIRFHLQTLSTKLNGLTCILCELKRKHVTTYLTHVKACSKLHEDSILSDGGFSEDSSLSRRPRNKRKKPKSRYSTEAVENEEMSQSYNNSLEEIPVEENEDGEIMCGVCKENVLKSKWYEHIGMEHNYCAWKEGEPALEFENEESRFQYLQSLSKTLDGLTCYKCNFKRKYVKPYLGHIKLCSGLPQLFSQNVKCGVCSAVVEDLLWEKHIQKEHRYLAWKEGQPALDLHDKQNVFDHLQYLSDLYQGLICHICNVKRKNVKCYLDHLKTCYRKSGAIYQSISSVDDSPDVKCGVCAKTVKQELWYRHIQIAHNYLAWKDGDTPFDVQNKKSQWTYLNALLDEVDDLICPKCGFLRRNAKVYLAHSQNCKAEIGELYEDLKDLLQKTDGLYECGMCHEKVKPEDWSKHSLVKHYNLAWIIGDVPVDCRDTYGMEITIRRYQKVMGKLECNTCGTRRVSPLGFFAHIASCGTTDEEADLFKGQCNICGIKYLGVYKNQHMVTHRENECEDQQKEKQSEKEEILDADQITPVRRKAAQKAQTVIENYTSDDVQDIHACKTCGFTSENEKRFARHRCEKKEEEFDAAVYSDEDGDDSGSSGVPSDELESSNTDKSEDEDSDIVKDNHKKDSQQKPSWVPFKVANTRAYLRETAFNFCKEHFSGVNLFPQWRECKYERLPKDKYEEYMPQLKQSCRLDLHSNTNTTLDRLEGKYILNKYHCIFVGGSAGRVAWAPPTTTESQGTQRSQVDDYNYLAVLCHRTGDSPRFNYHEIRKHSGLLQIWEFGTFKRTPKFSFGLAHDFGTIWDLCWCPSGTRDYFTSEDKTVSRLGLLAVACSNGKAYIFSVPYPDSIEKDTDEKVLIKLKPVVELRFIKSGSSRKEYQATSLSWSKKKGHEIVIVGYADGNIAFFDLTTESPLLKTTENDVTILYPFRDDRLLNICVSGVDMFPSGGDSADVGAVCGTSVCGSVSAASAGSRPARLVSHVSGAAAHYAPCWPSALLAGCDVVINQLQNEMEWFGTGRRHGGLQASSACARCGRLAMFTPPALRTVRLFPPCYDNKKKFVLSVKMAPLSGKKRKKENDDISMNLEPITYEDAVKKYSIKIEHTCPKDLAITSVKDIFPERFPLADVNSMAYSPSPLFHNYLAVAMHAGIVIVLIAE